MADGVGEGLLNDPEGGHLDLLGEPPRALDLELDGKTRGLPDLGHVPAEGGHQTQLVEQGGAEIPQHLVQVAAGLLGQGLHGSQPVPEGAGDLGLQQVDVHHQRVEDLAGVVVELARHPAALLLLGGERLLQGALERPLLLPQPLEQLGVLDRDGHQGSQRGDQLALGLSQRAGGLPCDPYDGQGPPRPGRRRHGPADLGRLGGALERSRGGGDPPILPRGRDQRGRRSPGRLGTLGVGPPDPDAGGRQGPAQVGGGPGQDLLQARPRGDERLDLLQALEVRA